MGIIRTWGDVSKQMEESTACEWWGFMDLLWITLTSWATFLYPQHLLCLTLDVLSLLKIHVSSFPYMGTQWQSVPPVFGGIGWGTEQWAEEAKVCPLSRSQPSLKSQTQPLSSSALDFLGSCLAPGSQEDKNPAWNTSQCGRGGFRGVWRETSPGAVIPYPPLHWRVPFPNVRLVDSPEE